MANWFPTLQLLGEIQPLLSTFSKGRARTLFTGCALMQGNSAWSDLTVFNHGGLVNTETISRIIPFTGARPHLCPFFRQADNTAFGQGLKWLQLPERHILYTTQLRMQTRNINLQPIRFLKLLFQKQYFKLRNEDEISIPLKMKRWLVSGWSWRPHLNNNIHPIAYFYLFGSL